MFTQLNPALPLHVLERGNGYAIGVIDYGQEHNLIRVTILDANGEVWCAPKPSVRFGEKRTMGRGENPLIAKDKRGGVEPPAAALATTNAQACDACQEKVAH